MFSATVSDGKTLFVWGTNPMPAATSWSARWLVMSSPLRLTVPSWTVTRPNNDLSSVDLPAPLGPMIPTSSPSWQWMLALLRMLTPGR